MSSFFSWMGSRSGNRIGNQENIPESTQKYIPVFIIILQEAKKIASSTKNYEPLELII